MSKLESLRDQVEGGVAGGWMVFSDALGPLSSNGHVLAQEAYNGSLDAAISLMEAVLPGWSYCMRTGESYSDEGKFFANIWGDVDPNEGGEHFVNYADIQARALLLCILDALISQEDKQ